MPATAKTKMTCFWLNVGMEAGELVQHGHKVVLQ